MAAWRVRGSTLDWRIRPPALGKPQADEVLGDAFCRIRTNASRVFTAKQTLHQHVEHRHKKDPDQRGPEHAADTMVV